MWLVWLACLWKITSRVANVPTSAMKYYKRLIEEMNDMKKLAGRVRNQKESVPLCGNVRDTRAGDR